MVFPVDPINIDPWRVATDTTNGEPPLTLQGSNPPRLQIRTIDDLQPLGPQIGAFPKKTVPDALYDAILGHGTASSDATKAAVRDLSVPVTYAILDPLRLDGLTEFLQNSGLEHRCLVKGKAFDDFGQVAPWLVQLQPDNKFTRNLFTSGVVTSGFWDIAPGVFLRSAGDLETVWRHLRKFVQAQDEHATRFYMRLWDPTSTVDLFAAYFDDGLGGVFAGIDSIIVPDGNRADILTARGQLPRPQQVTLTERGRQRYLDRRQARLSAQISRHFLTLPEFSDQTEGGIFVKVDHYITQGRKAGFQEGADLFNFALGFCLCDDPDLLRAEVARIFSDGQMAETERRQRILDRVQEPIDRAKHRAENSKKAN